jgi:hypothetical protein
MPFQFTARAFKRDGLALHDAVALAQQRRHGDPRRQQDASPGQHSIAAHARLVLVKWRLIGGGTDNVDHQHDEGHRHRDASHLKHPARKPSWQMCRPALEELEDQQQHEADQNRAGQQSGDRRFPAR